MVLCEPDPFFFNTTVVSDFTGEEGGDGPHSTVRRSLSKERFLGSSLPLLMACRASLILSDLVVNYPVIVALELCSHMLTVRRSDCCSHSLDYA